MHSTFLKNVTHIYMAESVIPEVRYMCCKVALANLLTGLGKI